MNKIEEIVKRINDCNLFEVEVKREKGSSYLVRVRLESYSYEIRVYGRSVKSMLEFLEVVTYYIWNLYLEREVLKMEDEDKEWINRLMRRHQCWINED